MVGRLSSIWRPGSAVRATAAAVIVALSFAAATSARAQENGPEVVEGTAEWRNGTGDCNTGVNVPNFENGTGTPYTDVDMPTEVTVDGRHVTVVWTDPGFNHADFLSPVEGDIAEDGTFSLIGRNEFDPRWQWDGQLSGDSMAGQFTREANFATGQPNCIATWDVTVRFDEELPLSGDAPPATTGERPTAERSGDEGDEGGDDLGGWPFVAVIVAVAAGAGWWWWRTRERPPQPPPPPPVETVPCGCSCTVTIAGRAELKAGDPETRWTLADAAGDTVHLVATGRFGEHREVYMATVDLACAGGASTGETVRHWRLGDVTVDHVDLHVSAQTPTTCPDGTTTTTSCEGSVRITLRRHCGPDITDQYIFALNRIIGRLRGRKIYLDSFPNADAEAYVAMQRWDAKRFGPAVGLEFMAVNGPWINFRPYSQDFKNREPPFWAPERCPSCVSCGATATILGRCVNLHASDALMFGLAAAMVGVSQTTMNVGGLFAKTVSNLHILETATWEEVVPAWQLGYKMGEQALASDTYRVIRTDVWLGLMVLLSSAQRTDCAPCADHVPINGVDWSSMDWSFGTGGAHYLESLPPPD